MRPATMALAPTTSSAAPLSWLATTTLKPMWMTGVATLCLVWPLVARTKTPATTTLTPPSRTALAPTLLSPTTATESASMTTTAMVCVMNLKSSVAPTLLRATTARAPQTTMGPVSLDAWDAQTPQHATTTKTHSLTTGRVISPRASYWVATTPWPATTMRMPNTTTVLAPTSQMEHAIAMEMWKMCSANVAVPAQATTTRMASATTLKSSAVQVNLPATTTPLPPSTTGLAISCLAWPLVALTPRPATTTQRHNLTTAPAPTLPSLTTVTETA